MRCPPAFAGFLDGTVSCQRAFALHNRDMTVRVGSIVLGASDVRRAMGFWGRALGYVPREEPEDTWVVRTPASGDGPNISLGLSEPPVQDRPRVHVDLYSSDQAAEVHRPLGLGAFVWTGRPTQRARISWCSQTLGATASS
jgi:hypothetical protein